MLAGKVRRSQVGQMIVVQEKHVDPAGRPCLGTGRALGSWPLHAELRFAGETYELRVGAGTPRAFVSREAVVAALRELGVDRDAAQRLVASVEPGRPVVLEVSERRRQPRSRST
jgi:hypothetical protein